MIDLYANSAGNYNGVIVSTSGSGKTFFANELVTSYLGTGAKVWVIDVGKGYKKQCDWAGGQFMSFGPNDDVRMNPFPMVRDINEDMEIIHPLVAQMAIGNSSQELSLIQYSSIGKAIRLLWDEYGNALTISNIRDKLKTGMLEAGDPYDKEVADLATMLDKFCVGGAYGKYFDGPPNIDFSSDFIVLELEELNGKKDLQAVVLLMMIYRITEEMFRTSRDRQKIVLIDEAWDLLAGGRTAAEFIEKGYRRARKYEGSFLTATQGINDYYKSPAATAALDNADWMFILRQKPEAIASFEKTGRLVMSDGMRTMMGNLRMVENEYSDLYVSSPVGAGLMRCIVDPFSTVLYSSRGASDTEVDSYLKQGMTVFQAIEKVVERKRLMQ
jgi:conjugal transfer ATP-binding protein TraC